MSFNYRFPASSPSYTSSDTASSSTRATPTTDASSCTTSTSPCPDPCFGGDDYELENELLIAACATRHDDFHHDEESRKIMKLVDVRMHWEDNAVNMQVGQASLDKIEKAQRRRRQLEREEKKERRRMKRTSTGEVKDEKEGPKFYDFMAEVRSRTRVQKMPSWTYDEMAEWSKDSAELATADSAESDEVKSEPVLWVSPSEGSTLELEVSGREVSLQADVQVTIVKEEVRDIPSNPSPLPFVDKESKCEIRPISGKGLGVVATHNIALGQAIITESPFFTVDHPPLTQQVNSQLSRITEDQRDLFHTFNPTLASYHPNRLIDIVATNVIPLGGELIDDVDDDVVPLRADGEVEERCKSGLFKTICRVNHSCAPNSRWTWFESGIMILRALRPIASQEEVTACYLQDTSMGYDDRQRLLFNTWRFICICPVCTLPMAARLADDGRRARFREIQDAYIDLDVTEAWSTEGLVGCSKMIKKAIKLLEEGKQYEEIANCRWSLFILSVRWGDEEKARREGSAWLREVSKMGDFPGDECKAHAKRPRSSPDWGMYDDDRSGDESECDTEDDFETSHGELMRIRFETIPSKVSFSRQSRRNSARTATMAGM